MKRLIILLCALTSLVCLGFAQGDHPLIEDWCVCVADYTCDDMGTCQNASCSSTDFMVPANGTYLFSAGTECSSGGSCKHCVVCAWISYSGGTMLGCDNMDSCHTICYPSCPPIYLHPNTTYTLHVCKIPCSGSSCSDCNERCRAVACVKNWSGAQCPNP